MRLAWAERQAQGAQWDRGQRSEPRAARVERPAYGEGWPHRPLLDVLPVMVGYLDRELRFRICNSALSAALGCPADHAVGRTLQELLPHEPELHQAMQDALTSATSFQTTAVVEDPNGKRLQVELTCTAERGDDGEAAGIIVFGEDVTERARVRQELAVSERRRREGADLLARAAQELETGEKRVTELHARIERATNELRSRVVGILNWTAVGTGELARASGQERIAPVVAGCRRMGAIIEELAAAGTSAAAAGDRGELDLRAAVLAVKGRLVQDAERRRIRLEGGGQLPPACANARQVDRAIELLLASALSVSPLAAVIRVAFELRGGELVVTIVDRGPGMTAAAFPSADADQPPSTRVVAQAEARRLVEANAGRLWVERHEGAGAAVSLALPLAPPRPAP